MSRESLFSVSPDDGLLGAYQYLNLHSYIKHWPPIDKSEVPAGASGEKLLYLSLARYAHIHETRHFHDFFGTLAGASLFFAHFEMLRSLVAMIEMSRQTDERWFLPFPDWIETSKFRAIYEQHLRSWRVYRAAAVKLTQAFRARAITRRFPDEYVVYAATAAEGDPTAAFPFDVGVPERDLRLTVVYPLSLTALLEGNAQALQRTLAEAEFPPEVAKEFTPQRIGQLLWKKDEPAANLLDSVAASIQPYNATDFMVSKYLRLKHGTESFRREALLRLTDIALSSSAILPAQKDDLDLPVAFNVSGVGMEFVKVMERSSPEDLSRARIDYPPVLLEAYTELLDSVTDVQRPEDVSYTGDLSSPLVLLESIIRHHVMAPLIKARIDTNHAVFYSVTEYMRRFPELPAVPVLEHEGGMTFAPYMSDKACDAWGKYVFLSRVFSQLMDGAPVLTCPRSDQTLGQIGNAEFCMEGECAEHIGQGDCAGWHPEGWQPLPNCLFSNILRVFLRGELNQHSS